MFCQRLHFTSLLLIYQKHGSLKILIIFVSKYVHKWLNIPVSSTLSLPVLANANFGLNPLPSIFNLAQCQTAWCNALSYFKIAILNHRRNTNSDINLQSDIYRNTKNSISAVFNLLVFFAKCKLLADSDVDDHSRFCHYRPYLLIRLRTGDIRSKLCNSKHADGSAWRRFFC